MLSFYRGTEELWIFLFFLKRLKRGNPAPLMPWGGPLHKEEVHLRGVRRVAMETGEPPPASPTNHQPPTNQPITHHHREAWPQVQTRKRGDKKDARYGNLGNGEKGVRSLTGPRLKKVPRLNLNTTQRAAPRLPPRLGTQSVPPKLLTFV